MKGVLELKNRITMSRAPSARPVKQSTKYKKKKKKDSNCSNWFKSLCALMTGVNGLIAWNHD